MGVSTRANIRNPKKQLALDSIKDIWDTPTDSDVNVNDDLGKDVVREDSGTSTGTRLCPFNSKLWNTRVSIQSAYEALYTVEVRLLSNIQVYVYMFMYMCRI